MNRKKVTVKNIAELDEAVKKVVVDNAKEETVGFIDMIKLHIENEFVSSIRTTGNQYMDSNYNVSDSQTNHIVSAIRNAKITKSYKNGVLSYIMTIENTTDEMKNGLIEALNDGTGIYNKKNPHMIKPKGGKKYMFIPGYRFAKKLFDREVKKNVGGRKTYSRAAINKIMKNIGQKYQGKK